MNDDKWIVVVDSAENPSVRECDTQEEAMESFDELEKTLVMGESIYLAKIILSKDVIRGHFR